MWFQKPPLGTPLNWENPLNDELALHLAMNEGHGDKVQDLSMNSNHGTLNNFAFPPTVASGWNPGQTGVGLNFDGADDSIGCGNNASLNIASGTIGVIFKSGTTQPDHARLIGMGISTDRVSLSINDTKHLNGYSKSGDVGLFDVVSTDAVNDNIRHCATLTFDTSGADLYLDGVIVATISGDKTLSLPATPATYIGKSNIFLNLEFKGSIDQPRILNRAYTAKEVLDYAINPWSVYLDEDD